MQSVPQTISRLSCSCSKALLALLAGLVFGALAPAHASAVMLGVGGISPEGLRSPLFGTLGVREARVGVAWNAAVSHDPTARRHFAAWLDAAHAAGVTPLVSFSQLAAAYFNVLRSACRGSIVLAGDVFLFAEQLKPWLTRYVKALNGAPKRGWALHNYRDVRDHSTKQLRVLMSLTTDPIWLDETAGVLRRGD